METIVRAFEKHDAGGVKELILSILEKEYPFDRSAYSDSDLDTIAEVYGGSNERFFIRESGGKIVGTVGVKEDDKKSALLRRLFVSPGHRKQGIGSSLLGAALGFCKEKGYRTVAFRCTDRMKDAIRLCESHGFKEVESVEMGGFKIHKLTLELAS